MSLTDLKVVSSVVVEGGYGATVGETGPEKPDVLIVPRARIYDLVPVRELPDGPAAPSLHQRPDRWQHPTTCQSSSKTVRLVFHRVFQPSPDQPLDFERTIEATLLDLKKRFQVRKVLFDPYQMQACELAPRSLRT